MRGSATVTELPEERVTVPAEERTIRDARMKHKCWWLGAMVLNYDLREEFRHLFYESIFYYHVNLSPQG